MTPTASDAGSDFGDAIPNSLANHERHSWALAAHDTAQAPALAAPLRRSGVGLPARRLVRFSGFYRARQSGAKAQG